MSDSSCQTVIQKDIIETCEEAVDTFFSVPFCVPSNFDHVEEAFLEVHSNKIGTLAWSIDVFINKYDAPKWNQLKGVVLKSPIETGRNRLDIKDELENIKKDDFVNLIFLMQRTNAYDTIPSSIISLRLNVFYNSSEQKVNEDGG